jgi:hypothetical protein
MQLLPPHEVQQSPLLEGIYYLYVLHGGESENKTM